MAELTVEQNIDAFFDEWMKTIQLVAHAIESKDFSQIGNVEVLPGMKTNNSINPAGNTYLYEAATGLLWREKLSAKLTVSTARQALIDGLIAHLPKAISRKILSERAVIAKAVEKVRAHPRDDGTYVFPVVFAPRAKTTDVRIGAARLIAKPIFDAEMSISWKKHDEEASEISLGLANDWREHSADFDHYITVDIQGFEEEMAWPAARDAAETLLNVVRMFFGFRMMDDVRIGNGFIWQTRRSSLRITKSGEIWLSSSFGGSGLHLEDGWERPFNCQLMRFALLLATTVSWHTHNDGRRNPILERLTYFNRLISEAYCEPYHPIRLVRLVSALEALSMIGPIEKAHNLAHRCGAAGGWGDPFAYCEIYDAVREAYRWRNAVVHGDAPPANAVLRAFYGVEKRLAHIYLGMLALHAGIANAVSPKSVSILRREFDGRIDMFFWAPSLVT